MDEIDIGRKGDRVGNCCALTHVGARSRGRGRIQRGNAWIEENEGLAGRPMEDISDLRAFDGLQFGGTGVLGNPKCGNVRPVIGTRRGGLSA